MKVYWDTSAIVRFYATGRAQQVTGITRTHTLAELFSALTGRGYDEAMKDGSMRHRRLSMEAAAKVISKLVPGLEFVDLSPDEVLAAIQDAKNVNAQGGRIHDLLHAVAASKAKADELWTLDRNDFAGLGTVSVKQL
jgi:predicted nucleic acid-binding protein